MPSEYYVIGPNKKKLWAFKHQAKLIPENQNKPNDIRIDKKKDIFKLAKALNKKYIQKFQKKISRKHTKSYTIYSKSLNINFLLKFSFINV